MIIEIVITTVKEFQEAYNIKIVDGRILFLMLFVISIYTVYSKFYSRKDKYINRTFYRYSLYINKKYVRECSASWLFYNIVDNISKDSFNILVQKKIYDRDILITHAMFYKLNKEKKKEYRKVKGCYVLCRFDYSNSKRYVKQLNKILLENLEIKIL